MWHLLLTHTPLLYFVQSLWRDEAFSVLAARQSLQFIITRLGFEPPIYYMLLHYWMRVFGESEIATRSLSVVGYLLATTIIIEWAHVLYKKHWLSWYVPLFFFLNPMLLYYAFEVRTYAWYIFFATATLFTYSTAKWRWFIVFAILGFYTHAYLLLYIGVLGLHYLFTKRTKHSFRSLMSFLKHDRGMRSFLIVGVLMIPWLIKIAHTAAQMKSSWYFPVDLQLVRSVLGNMFIGYEGTPWYGWGYTFYLSLIIIGVTIVAFQNRTHRSLVQLTTVFGGLPLITIIGISFWKPLFVNRYLIPTTIAEILLITAGIAVIKKPWIQKIIAGIFLSGVIWFNWWYPPKHPKLPIRNTFEQIHMLLKENDIIMADNPMIYLETLYYANDRSRVYLYNPRNAVFPWYIGDALITPSKMLRDFPLYPTRAFLVHTDASFEVTYRMPL